MGTFVAAQRRRERAAEASADRGQAIEASRAGGQALDSAARAYLEPRFGHDFANVRVHSDAEADRLASDFDAVAFTTGQDIFFRQGACAPDSTDGLHLLAHELTHTIQQAAGPVAGTPGPDGIAVSDPSDAFEQTAEHTADRVMSGASAAAPAQALDAPPAVQRQEASDRNRKQQSGESGDVGENLANVLDFSKGLMTAGSDILKDTPGIGWAFEGASNAFERGAKGEGAAQAAGGGILQTLTSGLTEVASDEAKELHLGSLAHIAPWQSGVSNWGGVVGSGMKALGGIMGEKAGPSIGMSDVGDYVNTASQMANPESMVSGGIKEGFGDLYNLAQSGAAALATGSDKPLLDLGDRELKGDLGTITQGWSMIANVIGSAATGDWHEMDRIGSMADQGKLGALPKLGSKMGDWFYDLLHPNE